MAVKATYLDAAVADPIRRFIQGVPARDIQDAEWATLTSAAAVTISGSTAADPSVITTATDHGLAVDDSVTIAGHSNTALNGRWRVAAVPSSTTFTVDVPTTATGSGGTVTKDSQQGRIAASGIYTVAP